MSYVQGNGNPFAGTFSDQCTYWAQQRYHALTGIWTPCTGNGYQWAQQAQANGWQVTSQAPTNVPSIACFQPGIQMADPNYGHVAVVEKVNADGSIYTSNYNYYPHIGDRVVVYATFRQGPGVSFIYAASDTVSLGLPGAIGHLITGAASTAAKTYGLTSNSNIATVLAAADNFLIVQNPFNVDTSTIQDNLGLGVHFTDPVAWMGTVATNLFTDVRSILIRLAFILLGIYVLFQVLKHFVDVDNVVSGAMSRAGQVASSLAPLVA